MSNLHDVSKKPYEWVDTLPAVKSMIDFILAQPEKIIGVDLEFCGQLNVFATALMQVSTLEKDFVVDALIL